MEFLERLARLAETDRVAIRYRDAALTFAQLDAQSDAFAAWLRENCGEDRSPVVT